MARVAIVDLLFRWPPDGGARVDVKEIGARLARHHDVRLFVPRHWMRIGRGRVQGDMGLSAAAQPIDRARVSLGARLGSRAPSGDH
jgi:hypothetical protein